MTGGLAWLRPQQMTRGQVAPQDVCDSCARSSSAVPLLQAGYSWVGARIDHRVLRALRHILGRIYCGWLAHLMPERRLRLMQFPRQRQPSGFIATRLGEVGLGRLRLDARLIGSVRCVGLVHDGLLRGPVGVQ
ncbi:hypothetical protein DMO17_11045 [Aquipseudomonas alcaligenes]|uniref:Uncharacterized protein n=1 Tax=Aquipseudomonas alcaligenes TaxID=43263 RepID=A0A2V4LU17_AQUAC|nr:hypothetical protein DMO17_11045 [Pseudomonas alcaligenes]